MFLSLLLAIGTLTVQSPAIAGPVTLSCEDYKWIVEGLEESDSISEVMKAEIRIELIRATDPICFENQDANVDEGTGL